MIYSRQRMPLIEINKVKISKNKNYSFEIDFSLNQVTRLSSLDMSKRLLKYNNIKIVFIILKTETESFLPKFNNLEKRAQALTDFKKDYKDCISEISISEFAKIAEQTQKKSIKNTSERLEIFTGSQTVELSNMSETKESLIEKMHLLTFLQIQDLSAQVPEYMYTKESELGYELLMVKSSDNTLMPASKREVFYAPSKLDPRRSVPYNGPAHYHSKSNPGPGGYIGWMASHPNGKMGPKLSVVEVDNYKVIYEDLLDSKNTKEITEPIPNDYAISSTGTDMLIHAKKKINFSKKISKQTANKIIKDSAISSLEKNKKSFFKGFGQQTVHASISESANVSKEYRSAKHNNYQGFVFGLDFLSMLKYRSSHGPLLDFHHNKSNMKFVLEALRNAKIDKITITRERISDRANFKNKMGTFEHSIKKEKPEEKIIVTSSDSRNTGYKGSLKKYRSFNGQIQEINLLALSPENGEVFEHPESKHIRYFILKDFDIFHNQIDGTYTYKIEIDIKDGIKKMLDTRLANLKKAVIFFEKYYQDLVILSKSKLQKSGTKNQNKRISSSIVKVYIDTVNLLEGRLLSKSEIDNLTNSVSKTNLDLPSVSKFLTSLKALEKSFNEKLNIKDSRFIGKKSSSNLVGLVPGNIQISINTGVNIKAFDESKMMANFLENAGRSPAVSISKFESVLSEQASKVYDAKYRPKSLVSVRGQQYQVTDSYGKSKKNENKISDLEITEITTDRKYDLLSEREKSTMRQKVAVLEKSNLEKSSLINKGDLFYANQAQKLGAGVEIQIVSKDIKPVSDSGDFDNFEKKLSSPKIKSDLQKAIIEVSKKVDTKEEILKEVESKFKSEVKIRERLGSFYDGITSAYKIKENILSSPKQGKIYENKYKGKIMGLQNQNLRNVSVMEEYACTLKCILPGDYEEEINLQKIKITPPDNRGNNLSGYLLMKLENTLSKTAMPLNNLFFVEVK